MGQSPGIGKEMNLMLDGLPASLAEDLQKVVDPAVLTAPGLEWRLVAPQCLRFLITTVAGRPWINQLALAALVMTAAKLNRSTIRKGIYSLPSPYRILFPAYNLLTFQDLQP